jgi:hypothetical protein
VKIRESDFASGLAERIRVVLKKLRMDAPKLDGKGMGNDANTVAEYLDSALPQDRVGDFERVCLESDKHLSEVAACHQVLALVLGKPADVPPELRERIYALGRPEALSAGNGQVVAPPPLPGNGQPRSAETVERAAPLEVPEYLRSGRERSMWPLVGVVAASLLLGLVILTLMGPWKGQRQLAKADGESAPGTSGERTAETAAQPADAAANASQVEAPAATTAAAAGAAATEPPAESANQTAAAAAPAAVAGGSPKQPSEAPAPAPADVATIKTNTAIKTGTAATTNTAIKANTAEKVAAAAAPSPTLAPTATTEAPPIPDVPAAPPLATTPPATMPPTVARAGREAREVGRFTTDGQLLATFNAEDGLWYPKRPTDILVTGERLTVLPPYRPQVGLPSAIEFTFAGEGSVTMQQPGPDDVPRMAIDYGRLLAVTPGKAGADVMLNLAGIEGKLTLVDADSARATKAARWVPPGMDPEAGPGLPVIEMYNINGRATWQTAGVGKVEIPMNHVHAYVGNEPPETHGPFFAPDWIDVKSVPPIDREHALKLERLISVERPLNLSLQELMPDRRVEVRSMSARCLAAIGEFEPILRELNDPQQYSYWAAEFDSLRKAIQRSPEMAGKIRETLALLRSADAKDLYRLLWGYSQEQLDRGASTQLVRFLEHDQMDIRVLSYMNLVSITGVWGFYRPERIPAQQKTSIQNWRDRRDKGQIIYRLPPSPLDTYKPMASPVGGARPTGPAGPAAGGAPMR